ncbi:hypothetical protein [Kaistella palustris]|uniref:hypothetical protein n=1 Tax=Kaistella palustris TaxID=493376 RepID=UPI0003FF1F37|nr:hypothetical protein [Kaistella palustris]
MSPTLFNPFDDLIFNEQFCFLTGELTTEKMPVYPNWLMDHFKFREDRIEMMDKSKSYTYNDLQLPCSPRVKKAFEALDETFYNAYKKGFQGIEQLDEQQIFLWAGRMVYGMLYYEMYYESNRMMRQREEFDLSPMLRERFGNFHLMLKSIVEPVSFVGHKPWSIIVFPLKYSADIISYRDDTVNLLFQFGVNGFGFIACLQDNGVIGEKEKELTEKMKGHVLHPLQFEELFARFHYADYILQYKPQYKIDCTEEGVSIEAIPIMATEDRPVFAFWDEEVFAQLLTNYWSVYGIQREDIIQFQKPFLSFLQNPYTKEFVVPETINQPF